MASSLEDEIHSMYREIIDYRGSFGDGTAGIPLPFGRLRESLDGNELQLTEFELVGFLLGGLCHIAMLIDNGGHAQAILLYEEDAEYVLQLKLQGVPKSVIDAYEVFRRSEGDFWESLGPVYREVVLPAESEK